MITESEGRAAETAPTGLDALGERGARIAAALHPRSLVLVGLMGCGKTSIGKRLAKSLGMRFADADAEIEAAAQMSIPEIFATQGEPAFRSGERRVIARLLTQGPLVLATGGGAFMDGETRRRIAESGLSVWLRAELPVLMGRVRRRSNRPLLHTADPEAKMRALMAERYPIYALADLTVESEEGPHDKGVRAVMDALDRYLLLDHRP